MKMFIAAFLSLIMNFWVPERADFKGENHYWHYAQSFDIAAMAKDSDLLEQMYQGQLKRGYFQTGTIYYDDENWMALALIRSYSVVNNPAHLDTATKLLDVVKSAEVFDQNGNTRGVRWSSQNTGVATASNMGPVITACLLYNILHRPEDLEFALRIYSHWKATMLENTYQVADFRNPDGSRELNPYTYDQGLMIGAAVELYRITNDETYLEDARGLFGYVQRTMTNNGILVEPKCRGRLNECKQSNDIAQFKGITVKFIVELAKVDPENASVREFISKTTNAIWETREPQKNLFTLEWDGSDVPGETSYGAANSAAMALGAADSL